MTTWFRRHFGATVALSMLVPIGMVALGGVMFGEDVVSTVTGAVVIGGTPIFALRAVRSRGARASFGTLLSATLAVAAMLWVLAVLDARWYAKAGLILVVVSPLMSWANRSFGGDLARVQRDLNDRSAGIAMAVRDGEEAGDYALYLRPFFTTERLAAQPVPQPASSDDFPVHLDVETVLARAMPSWRPLVALGRADDITAGAGRITLAEDEWRKVVFTMLDEAQLVVLVPLARPGTLEEIRAIIDRRYLRKTIFLMPESVGGAMSGVVTHTEGDRLFDVGVREYSGEEHHLDLVAEWDFARRTLRELGLVLPLLDQVGALFTLDPTSGGLAGIAPLGLSTASRRSEYLGAVVDWLLDPQRETSEVPNLIERSVSWKGRTLEVAYVRAAGGYVMWGDIETARRLLLLARTEGRPRAPATASFVRAIAHVADGTTEEELDDERIERCKAAARVLLADEEFARFAERASG